MTIICYQEDPPNKAWCVLKVIPSTRPSGSQGRLCLLVGVQLSAGGTGWQFCIGLDMVAMVRVH
jgi:hypothetical protein